MRMEFKQAANEIPNVASGKLGPSPNTLSQLLRWVRGIALILTSIICIPAIAGGKNVYRTGLQATRTDIVASPNGRDLIIDIHRLGEPLRMLDLDSGKISPLDVQGQWPSWSPDGRHVVVISTEMRAGKENFDNKQIQLLDSATWQARTLTSGGGVRVFPFFSADGKTIYYFKGAKRNSGKTPASHYDLHAIDVGGGAEKILTQELFYQMGRGDDDGNTVVFDATGGLGKRRYIDLKDGLGVSSNTKLFLVTNEPQPTLRADAA